MIIPLFPILLICLILGAFLLIRGLRGRTLDDHPVCRRCGFDLIGLPEGAGRCSECGADLHAPRAIRIGNCKRRAGLIATGSALLAIVLLTGGVAIVALTTNTNWQSYKPAWWLIRETASGDAKISNDALAELSSRLGAGTISQAHVDQLADRALALQANLSKPWVPAWGDLLESANASGKLSNDRWTKYLTQAAQTKLEVRPEVRRGDPIPYWLREANARVGSKASIYLNHKSKDWTLGPLKRTEQSGGGTMLSVHGSGATGSSITLKPEEWERLPDGSNEVVMSLDYAIGMGWNGPPIAKSKVELKSSFNLVPSSQPTAKLITDPSLRAAIEQSLTCREATYEQTWSPKQLNVSIHVNNNPVGIGFDVFAVFDGKEVKLGSFSCPAGRKNHGWGMSDQIPGFDKPVIDIVLKPNLKTALSTTDTFEVWDGRVTIKNVPVKFPAGKAPASKPATTSATNPSTTPSK